MTIDFAKQIIKKRFQKVLVNNVEIQEYVIALEIAIKQLGEKCTMEEVKEWANE